jgi:hypothetical protein
MKSETQNLLRSIKKRLSKDKQEAFASGIRARIAEVDAIMDTQTVAQCTIYGMFTGGLLDLIPGFETIAGVDGFVDIGAALGAFIGLAKSEKERKAREQLRQIIVEELNKLVPSVA